MYTKHYLHYYNDTESASCVPEAKENNFTPREFAESGYIPAFVIGNTEVFIHCLEAQSEGFAYDIFCRAYTLFEEPCPFTKEQFSVEEYSCGEDIQLKVIDLSKTEVPAGSFLQIVIIMDTKNTELYFLTVQKGEGEQNAIYSFDIYHHQWKEEAVAPTDLEELLGLILLLTVDKNNPKFQHYISARCPMCNRAFKLGLTEEEMAGYRKFQSGDEDVEDAVPGLNAFEREFLMTGMCPDCQSAVFRTELPKDLSRWALG